MEAPCFSKDSKPALIPPSNYKPPLRKVLFDDSTLSNDPKLFNDLGLFYNSKDIVVSTVPIDSKLSNELRLSDDPELSSNSRHSSNSTFSVISTFSNNSGLTNDSRNSRESGLSNNSRDSKESGFPIDSTLLYDPENFEDTVKLGHLVDLSFQASTANIDEDHGLFPAEKLHEGFFLTTGSSFGGSKVGIEKSRDDFSDNHIFTSLGQPDENTRVLYSPRTEYSDHGYDGRHSGSCFHLPRHQSEKENVSDTYSNSNCDVWPTTSRNCDVHNSQSYEEDINTKEKSFCSSSLIVDIRNLDSKPGSIYGYRCPTLTFRSSYGQNSLPNFSASADAVLGNLPQESVSRPRNDDTKPTAMEETAVSCDPRLSNPSSLKLELSCKETKVEDSSSSNSCSSWSSNDDTDFGDDESDRERHTAKIEIPHASMTKNQAPDFDTHPFFFKLKHELIDPIMLEFWERFNTREETIRFGKDIRQNTHISKCNTAQQDTTPTSKTDSPTTTSPEKVSETYKGEVRSKSRKRLDKGDDSDNEENKERNPKRPRNLTTPSRSLDDAIKFACPYRKHDAKKYCVQDWPSCALTSLNSVARVKGHLYRHHRIYQCQRCKRLFSNQGEVDEHLNQKEACELSEDIQEDGITNEIREKLRSKKKTHRNQSEEDRWKEMYRIIFPTDAIPNPYFEAVQEDFMQSPNAQQFTEYEEYCRQELPRVIEAEFVETINSLEKQIKDQLLEIIRNAQDRVFASYRSSSTLPGTNDGSKASSRSGSCEAVFPTSSSQIIATGYQFTSDEPGETYSTQEPHFLESPKPRIDLEPRLDVAVLDIEATGPANNDQLDFLHGETPGILSLLGAESISNNPVSSMDSLSYLPVNGGETNEAGNKADNLHLGSSIDEGENATGYFDSSLVQSGVDLDFANLDWSYFDNVGPLFFED